jgi:GTP diphosphokinase / guanosine-3',5'-bis(diphosphate) 3'-diphosphatase
LTPEDDIGRLLAALTFSAARHRFQRRKDASRTPYINHPIEVADVLWTVGGIRDVVVLCAAIFHDTLEDTDTEPQEIRDRFGGEVLRLVQEVTDDKGLPKAERKRLQIETAARKSAQAKCIKLADKICNLRDIIHSPPDDWSLDRIREYLLWTEKVVAELRGTNPALEACYDQELARGRGKYNI